MKNPIRVRDSPKPKGFGSPEKKWAAKIKLYPSNVVHVPMLSSHMKSAAQIDSATSSNYTEKALVS